MSVNPLSSFIRHFDSTRSFDILRTEAANKLQICKGTIHSDVECALHPEGFVNITLKDHQLQMINKMLELETSNCDINENEYIKTEMGILSNKVGSGKSFCILGLILSRKFLSQQPFVKHKYGSSIVVMDRRSNTNIHQGNLIISPHHILKPVWEKYIKDHTTLTYIILNKSTFPTDWNSILSYDIVLCTNKLHNKLCTECPFTWSRVIYDEADSISIPACVYPKYRFVWFISSSLKNLIFPSGYYAFSPQFTPERTHINVTNITEGLSHNGFIKDTFKAFEGYNVLSEVLSKIILKQSDEYVDNVLKIPDWTEIYHKCISPFYVDVLNGFIGIDVLSMLNANNYIGALERLGCTVDTKENIISIVCKNLTYKLENLEIKMHYLQSLNVRDNEKESHLNKIRKNKEKMHDISNRISDIQKKINDIDLNVSTEKCPVCFESISKTSCMLNCCMHVFCMECISKMLIHNNTTCPICRKEFNKNDMFHIGTKPINTDKQTKEECLLKLIQNNPDNKYLIFSSYDQSFTRISALLNQSNIMNSKIVGNQNTINQTLNRYLNSNNNVLLLNASHFGCGLNLTNTTDLIFYHKMTHEIKIQVIGRAQRLGRTKSLRVHYLFHDNEFD